MSSAGDMARDMETVLRALEHARVHVAGLDQGDAARKLAAKVAYSPLRTLLEQAERAAERVMDCLAGQSPPDIQELNVGRDGGPL